MKKLLHEPLVHFLLLGAALFGVYALVGGRAAGRPGEIVVTRGQVEQLVISFSRTWRRPPTQQELNGLVEEFVREEVLYREAVAIGLDRDDTIVRRRLKQKLEFLTEVGSQAAPPTDEELQAYFHQNADKYREEPRLSFEHIFFSRERRRTSAETEAKALLAQLNGRRAAAVNLDTAGDPSLLPIEMNLSPRSEIATLFGEAFSQGLLEVEPGRWTGPVESSYGLHLVFVRERVPGNAPELAKVREAVQRDLLHERRQRALDAAYAKLRGRYTIVVEPRAPQVAEAR